MNAPYIFLINYYLLVFGIAREKARAARSAVSQKCPLAAFGISIRRLIVLADWFIHWFKYVFQVQAYMVLLDVMRDDKLVEYFLSISAMIMNDLC